MTRSRFTKQHRQAVVNTTMLRMRILATMRVGRLCCSVGRMAGARRSWRRSHLRKDIVQKVLPCFGCCCMFRSWLCATNTSYVICTYNVAICVTVYHQCSITESRACPAWGPSLKYGAGNSNDKSLFSRLALHSAIFFTKTLYIARRAVLSQ